MKMMMMMKTMITTPFIPHPSMFNVLAARVVNALQLGLCQRRPDVRHLIQPQVQRLHPVVLPAVSAQWQIRPDDLFVIRRIVSDTKCGYGI